MYLTENGNTDIAVDPGRVYAFTASGDFGGGTLTLQWGDAGIDTAFKDAAGDVALTAAGGRVIVAPTRRVRFSLAGATAPSIKVNLLPVV